MEVLATYCTWDDYDEPPALMLPMRLLTAYDQGFRLRQLWLEEANGSYEEYDILMKNTYTIEDFEYDD